MKYRKKPVIIEAVRVSDAIKCATYDWKEMPAWLREAYENPEGSGRRIVFGNDNISITTLEGTMVGERGDWIIRGVQGELYPCKPDIFAATYEPVEEV